MIRPIVTNEAFSLRSYGGIINYFVNLLPELEALGASPAIAAIVTEKGVIEKPNEAKIRALMQP
ncbi:MAG: hypothetical protein HKN24_13980 [Acidimicrobiales bacterium]|nr:hypothetical protein [Acidimicrobiales bacterium]